MGERHNTGSGSVLQRKSDGLKDEVYRHMFRLEERRPGAERDLTIALLRAWIVLDSGHRRTIDRSWLRKICPICLAMIESVGQSGDAEMHSIQ